jgi:hypothetical protein
MRGDPVWPPWTRTRIMLAALLPVGLTAAALPLAFVAMFSLFQAYDDEGYLLLSLKGYLGGHALYDEVFSQYGPFYYLFNATLFRVLGLDVTHDAGRLVTMVLWLLAAFIGGVAITRLTRSLLLGLAGQVLFYGALSTLGNEPMHPGALLGFLLATIVLTMTMAPVSHRIPALLLGSLAGATMLVKVNVGTFLLVSLGVTLCLAASPFAMSLSLRILGAAAFIGTPFVIMARDLNAGWAASYATLVGLAAIALVVVTFRSPPDRVEGPRTLLWLVGGVTGVVILVAALNIATGSSLDALVDGAFLRPIRQHEAFSLPFAMPVWAPIVGAAGLAGAAIATWRSRRSAPNQRWEILGAAVRIAAGILIWIAIGSVGHVPGSPLSLSLPLVWIVAVPPRSVGEALSPFVRTSLAALAILQALHAYPVAGSQMAWSGMLLIPIGAICISDGWVAIRARALPAGPRILRVVIQGSVVFPLLVVLAWLVLWSILPSVRNGLLAYDQGVQPRLPGLSHLRIAQSQAQTYETLASTLRSQCSTFISMPGLNSLYFFAEAEPPTYLNTTAWMYLFDASTQSRVVERSRTIERLCTVRNLGLLDFWRQGRPVPPGPLVDFVSRDLRRVQRVDTYTVLVEDEERGA